MVYLTIPYYGYYYYNMKSWYYDIIKYSNKYKNFTDIIYFTCLNITNSNENEIEEIKSKNDDLKESILIISLITLIIIIIFYIVSKKSISKDNKNYNKNKIFINTFFLYKI